MFPDLGNACLIEGLAPLLIKRKLRQNRQGSLQSPSEAATRLLESYNELGSCGYSFTPTASKYQQKNRQGTQQEEVIGVKKILVNLGCSKEPHFNQVFAAGCGDFYTQARPALGTEVGSNTKTAVTDVGSSGSFA